MSPTLTFSPLQDSAYPFETAHIELEDQNQVYVVGFRKNPLAHHSSKWREKLGAMMDKDREKEKEKAGTVEDVGFTSELCDDKLCIVPAESHEARKMREVYAAIWLAPGYKVMLLPAEGSKVYYQRAISGNTKWKKIKTGYGVDLADPLMTTLDGAIHIKFDARPEPDRPSPTEFLRKLVKFAQRSRSQSHSRSPSPHSPHSPTSLTNLNAGSGGVSHFHSLVRHIHTEIVSSEVHPSHHSHHHHSSPHRSPSPPPTSALSDTTHRYEIAASVSIEWGERKGEGWRRLPSTGNLSHEGMQDKREQDQALYDEEGEGVEHADEMDVDSHDDANDNVDSHIDPDVLPSAEGAKNRSSYSSDSTEGDDTYHQNGDSQSDVEMETDSERERETSSQDDFSPSPESSSDSEVEAEPHDTRVTHSGNVPAPVRPPRERSRSTKTIRSNDASRHPSSTSSPHPSSLSSSTTSSSRDREHRHGDLRTSKSTGDLTSISKSTSPSSSSSHFPSSPSSPSMSKDKERQKEKEDKEAKKPRKVQVHEKETKSREKDVKSHEKEESQKSQKERERGLKRATSIPTTATTTTTLSNSTTTSTQHSAPSQSQSSSKSRKGSKGV